MLSCLRVRASERYPAPPSSASPAGAFANERFPATVKEEMRDHWEIVGADIMYRAVVQSAHKAHTRIRRMPDVGNAIRPGCRMWLVTLARLAGLSGAGHSGGSQGASSVV